MKPTRRMNVTYFQLKKSLPFRENGAKKRNEIFGLTTKQKERIEPRNIDKSLHMQNNNKLQIVERDAANCTVES